MLTQAQCELLDVLKLSLYCNENSHYTVTDLEAVVLEAKAQTVLGLISPFISVDNHYFEQKKAAYIRIMYEQDRLVKILDEACVPFVIIKGAAAAIYYPKPYLRTMGDVDLLVQRDKYEDTVRIMEDNGYIKVHSNDRHTGFEKNGIEFELHHHFSSSGFDIDDVLETAIERREYRELNGFSFPMLPYVENGLVLMGHINQHLRQNGLGLRQVLDWEMYISRAIQYEDWFGEYKRRVDESGLLNLAAYVTGMCNKYLGLSERVDWGVAIDETLEDELISVIMTDGNFNHRADYLGEKEERGLRNTSYKIEKNGFFKYFQDLGLKQWSFLDRFPGGSLIAFILGLFCQLPKGMRVLHNNRKTIRQIREGRKRYILYKKIGVKLGDD